MSRVTVVGFYGTVLDSGASRRRWNKWRPTVSLVQFDDLLVDRIELLIAPDALEEAETALADLKDLSPDTEVVPVPFPLDDPWDFEEVYGALHDYARRREAPDEEQLLVHITTGTHVAQICLFLLAETRFLPGRLLQTSPPRGEEKHQVPGHYSVIDLDLARYDRIASRFEAEAQEATTLLKQGIQTRSDTFNRLIARIEKVAGVSAAPILLMGPTGAGKSHLARQIYALKRQRRQLRGPMVEVNCATLRGDGAASALFGHRRGAFTGAVQDRKGLLKQADGGLLFLDEVGELGLDEQAMLLIALEEKRFRPVGAEREEHSDFQLIAGTNRDLRNDVAEGRFREDLLARIDLWTFELPGLRDRIEDLEPNLHYELELIARHQGRRVAFNREALRRFVQFGTGPQGRWSANFRDLNSAVTRMATLAPAGRIRVEEVDEEIGRLQRSWRKDASVLRSFPRVTQLLGPEALSDLDYFDQVQLESVLEVCERCSSLSEAGRELFAVSRLQRKTVNDSDRLRKYLARFALTWEDLR